MAFDFDQHVDRTTTSSLKWDLYKGRDVIPMWVADMDFPSPPEVLDTLKRRIDHGVFGYTLAPQALNEAVVARLQHMYNWSIEPESIVFLI